MKRLQILIVLVINVGWKILIFLLVEQVRHPSDLIAFYGVDKVDILAKLDVPPVLPGALIGLTDNLSDPSLFLLYT